MAFAAQAAWAQSSDERLVGTWSGEEAGEQLRVTFHVDGTFDVSGRNDSIKGTYKADFSKTPGTLTLKRGNDGEERASLIEFVDDNHIRVSEPGDTSINEGSPMVWSACPTEAHLQL